MSDEFDIVHLNHDDAQEIINWAVPAAGMILLIDDAPVSTNPTERLEGFLEAIRTIKDNMPESLLPHAAIIAQDTIDEEVEVNEFRKELDEL